MSFLHATALHFQTCSWSVVKKGSLIPWSILSTKSVATIFTWRVTRRRRVMDLRKFRDSREIRIYISKGFGLSSGEAEPGEGWKSSLSIPQRISGGGWKVCAGVTGRNEGTESSR